MNTLTQIETAADDLPAAQKQELILFLAARLRAESTSLPEPRRFSGDQMAAWIAEDEAEMARFQRSP